jgi:hypothetical protein
MIPAINYAGDPPPENGTVKSKSTSVAGGSWSRHTIPRSVTGVAYGSRLDRSARSMRDLLEIAEQLQYLTA